MRAPTPSEWLDVWELGIDLTPPERALCLLALGHLDSVEKPEMLGAWSIGQRDAHLLRLRERAFGSTIVGSADCPACAETVEFEFGIQEVQAASAPSPGTPRSLEIEGYDVEVRSPTSDDLIAATRAVNREAGRAEILRRCVLAVRCEGRAVDVADLPPGVLAALGHALAEANPRSNVRLTLTCPECHDDWQRAFDIGAYFWAELDVWVRGVLRDVHVLASTYGWSQQDILSLGTARRRLFVEMAGA